MEEFNIDTLTFEQTHFWRWLSGGGWSMSTNRIDILKAYDGEFGHKYLQNRTDVINFYSSTLTIYGERLKSKSV